MIQFFKSNIEPNKKLRSLEIMILVLLCIGSVISVCVGFSKIHSDVGQFQYQGTIDMIRDEEEEDYDSDSTVCDVVYRNGEKKLVVSYPYEEYENLDTNTIVAYEYETENGMKLYFDHQDVSQSEVQYTYQQVMAEKSMSIFNFGTSTFILALSLAIMMLFSRQFTTYEKSWFMIIMVLATIFSVAFPEEMQMGLMVLSLCYFIC